MLRVLELLFRRPRRAGGVLVAAGALCAGAAVTAAVAVSGFTAVVISTGQLIEQSLGLDVPAAPVSLGTFEALGQPVALDAWEIAQGREETAPAVAPRPVHVQTVSTASDTGKRFYSGDDDTYRTVCVRLCDGYYWTVSFSTTDENFTRDQGRCEASCGVPTRLYKYRNPGERPEDMEDLEGRPYSKLKTAFAFRTRYDASCRCQANPWEKAALAQHRLYELEAAPANQSPAQKVEAEQLKRLVESAATERRVKGAEVVMAAKIVPVAKVDRITRSAARSRPRRARGEKGPAASARQIGKASDGTEASGPQEGDEDGRPVITAAAKSGARGNLMRLGGAAPRPAVARSGTRTAARGGDWRHRVFVSNTGN